MNLQGILNIVVTLFAVASLGAMGLGLDFREVLKTLWTPRAIPLLLVWGWVAGPALARIIVSVVQLLEAYAAGLLLISLAPTVPFFPSMVQRIR